MKRSWCMLWRMAIVGVLIGVAGAPRLCVASSSQGVSDPAAAREVFHMLNEFRAKNGKPALEWDDRLAEAALSHAFIVAENKQLMHQYSGEPVLTLRLAKQEIRLNRAGENLASDCTVEGAHQGLIGSPPHRANMLSTEFNSVGIAVVKVSEEFYIVEDFAHRLPELSVAQFEEEVAAEFDALRAKSGVVALKHASSDALRNAACNMARSDGVDAKDVQIPGARFIVSFTITEPQKLPQDLTQLQSRDDLERYTMGACFARSQTYPNGTYWVLMALFPKNLQATRPE